MTLGITTILNKFHFKSNRYMAPIIRITPIINGLRTNNAAFKFLKSANTIKNTTKMVNRTACFPSLSMMVSISAKIILELAA